VTVYVYMYLSIIIILLLFEWRTLFPVLLFLLIVIKIVGVDQTAWQFVRRLFLVDNVSGQQATSSTGQYRSTIQPVCTLIALRKVAVRLRLGYCSLLLTINVSCYSV